jgi:hypothetical protein
LTRALATWSFDVATVVDSSRASDAKAAIVEIDPTPR